jgi:molecular chaperone GrpE
VGEPFNPEQHHAMFEIDAGTTKYPPGTVAVVAKKGYKFHDRMLRAAEVGVTKASS